MEERISMIKKISDFHVLYIGGNGKETIGCDFSGSGTLKEGYKEKWSESVDALRECSDLYLYSLGFNSKDIDFIKRR
jgi:hypothetical protein